MKSELMKAQYQSDVALRHIATVLATRIIIDARKSSATFKENHETNIKIWGDGMPGKIDIKEK